MWRRAICLKFLEAVGHIRFWAKAKTIIINRTKAKKIVIKRGSKGNCFCWGGTLTQVGGVRAVGEVIAVGKGTQGGRRKVLLRLETKKNHDWILTKSIIKRALAIGKVVIFSWVWAISMLNNIFKLKVIGNLSMIRVILLKAKKKVQIKIKIKGQDWQKVKDKNLLSWISSAMINLFLLKRNWDLQWNLKWKKFKC